MLRRAGELLPAPKLPPRNPESRSRISAPAPQTPGLDLLQELRVLQGRLVRAAAPRHPAPGLCQGSCWHLQMASQAMRHTSWLLPNLELTPYHLGFPGLPLYTDSCRDWWASILRWSQGPRQTQNCRVCGGVGHRPPFQSPHTMGNRTEWDVSEHQSWKSMNSDSRF